MLADYAYNSGVIVGSTKQIIEECMNSDNPLQAAACYSVISMLYTHLHIRRVYLFSTIQERTELIELIKTVWDLMTMMYRDIEWKVGQYD